MLKIKDKLRKRHTQAVSKQKQKYQEQCQTANPQSYRDSSVECSAKAALERSKMRLKMRGLSQTKIGGEGLPIEIIGTCSNAYEYAIRREESYPLEDKLRKTEGWLGTRTQRKLSR
jgi:ATP-dependent Lon protease